jgi:hypothetical protein
MITSNNFSLIASTCLSFIGMIIFFLQLRKDEFTISEVIGFSPFKKKYISEYFIIMLPIIYVTKIYIPNPIFNNYILDKSIHLFLMACIAWGLVSFPKLVVWMAYKVFQLAKKGKILKQKV